MTEPAQGKEANVSRFYVWPLLFDPKWHSNIKTPTCHIPVTHAHSQTESKPLILVKVLPTFQP